MKQIVECQECGFISSLKILVMHNIIKCPACYNKFSLNIEQEGGKVEFVSEMQKTLEMMKKLGLQIAHGIEPTSSTTDPNDETPPVSNPGP